MKITIEMLTEKTTREDMLDWFKENFPTLEADHLEILQRLEDQKTTTTIPPRIFKMFKLTGHCRTWYPDGQLLLECYFFEGKYQGFYREWYSNGQLGVECLYKGDSHSYKMWYDNGQLMVKCFYENGACNGLYRQWRPNGQLAIESFYKGGQLDGWRRKWYGQGLLKEEKFYKEGKEVK